MPRYFVIRAMKQRLPMVRLAVRHLHFQRTLKQKLCNVLGINVNARVLVDATSKK